MAQSVFFRRHNHHGVMMTLSAVFLQSVLADSLSDGSTSISIEDLSAPASPSKLLVFADVLLSKYRWELATLVLFLFYILNYIIGRKSNSTHASCLFKSIAPVIETNFSRVGSYNARLESPTAAVVEESAHSYFAFSSGRKGSMLGMHIRAELVRRQELVSYLLNLVGVTPSYDTLTFTAYYPSRTLDPFVYSMYRFQDKSSMQNTYKEAVFDYVKGASRPSPIDNRFMIAADANELVEAVPLVNARLMNALTGLDNKAAGSGPESRGFGLESVVVTDRLGDILANTYSSLRSENDAKEGDSAASAASAASAPAADSSSAAAWASDLVLQASKVPGATACVRVVVRVPGAGHIIPLPRGSSVDDASKMTTQAKRAKLLGEIASIVMDFMDAAAAHKLSGSAKKKNEDERRQVEVNRQKEVERLEREKVLEKRREEEAKAQAAAEAKMTREQRKKLEEKRAKEEARAKQRIRMVR